MCALTAFPQQYNNEWIDYTKTYYKFKLGQTGLCRLSQPTLNAAGLGSVPAEQFKLFRNGVEVPLYTTSVSGPLAANGYIEFWGEANDGRADKALYRNPAFQHSDKISLQTDTAMYFLTINAGSNKRLTEQANNAGSSPLNAELFFMHTAGTYFRTKINSGFARNAGEYVYSSSYDQGEYWSSRDFTGSSPLSDNITGLPVYAGGPQAYLRFGASGNTQNRRRLQVAINNTQLFNSELSIFSDTNAAPVYFPVSLIGAGNSNIVFSLRDADAMSPLDVNDRAVISYYDITYPRKFDFSQAKNFSFTLPAKNEGYLLSITNFNKGAVIPVLYDLAANERYTAVYSATGDSVKFALPGTTQQRNLVLVNQETSNVIAINSLTPRSFINYANTSRQGDYIIISNPLLYNGTSGNNPVNDYRDYRRSADGGNYNAIIIEIDELVDQFAFGIKKHPLSIKNFVRYARTNFSVLPKYVFMIGRGVDYVNYRNNESSNLIERLNLIPSFGYPASDNFLSSLDALSAVPVIPIGRLSTVHAYEVADYLQKMKEYENVQKTAPNTIKDRLWMKNVMHVTGASQSELGVALCNFMSGYKSVLDDTLVGTNVSMFCKSSANPVEELSSNNVADLFEEGLSMVTYFGHSSTTTLEFNIDDPQNYNSTGKYPVFSVNGCNAGNFFTYYPARLDFNETLSEKFVLAKQKGGIAFLASTHFGIVNYLNIYLNYLYRNLSGKSYNQSLGVLHENSLRQLIDQQAVGDFFARCHAEEITLHGDPALKMNFQDKPDYVIEDPQVKISPNVVSIADNEFTVSAKIYNLGKAVSDSITLEIKRQYPDGVVETISKKKIGGIRYSDSLSLKVPVIATRDKGVNKITITIDSDDVVVEESETNNSISHDVFIYEDEARPAFPYNFSIVSKPDQKLFASTANPVSSTKSYIFEIDTTELFNSALKVSKEITAPGGIIEINPQVSFINNTVYYWRTSLKPVGSAINQWNNSSFIYIASGGSGFNQSHYYQNLKSSVQNISLSENRIWNFGSTINNLFIKNGVFPGGGTQDNDFSVSASSTTDLIQSACVGTSLIFNVFDGKTFKPWKNVDINGNNLYLSGSASANCRPSRNYNFEFSHTTAGNRTLMSRFMDSIPDGNFVVVRSIDYSPSSNAPVWKADELVNGPGNSLYHRLLAAGFSALDSYNIPRAFAFVYKKGDPGFIPKYALTNGITDRFTLSVDGFTPDTLGFITSPVFGPAKSWKEIHWRGESSEVNSADRPLVDVIGIGNNNSKTVLYRLDKSNQDFDISSIDAKLYPLMQLKMTNLDSVTLTPYQLNYWRINYDPIPEGSIAPNLIYSGKDTLEIGEKLNFSIAFKNISESPFDSLRVKFYVIDNNNVTHAITDSKGKPLQMGDTIVINYSIDTKDFPGNNTLSVIFNPDNDQPEQYSFNNFLYKDFYVRPDKTNPLLDVTFDGVHILNNDIVSSKPHIQIKIKDEAKFMLLNDTSLVKELAVRFPDGNNTIRTYRFDNDTLKFTPARDGNSNTATIDFSPHFPAILDANGELFNPDGDDYELTVRAIDKSENNAGSKEFKVSFKVIDKAMISNLLNYPNPFTTSTAFVFVITGSEIPQNIKIQILTVTGKIVREITKEELGPLHIGRNITEYKWNGTDQYGQRLGNGVYLYRVITSLNGKRMDKYKSQGDDTDKYFNKGYGKMYLMR